MRNMYAHEYAKMDKLAIWETATMDIPQFSHFCDNIIEQEKELKKPEKATNKPSLVAKVKEKQEEAAKTPIKKTATKQKEIE